MLCISCRDQLATPHACSGSNNGPTVDTGEVCTTPPTPGTAPAANQDDQQVGNSPVADPPIKKELTEHLHPPDQQNRTRPVTDTATLKPKRDPKLVQSLDESYMFYEDIYDQILREHGEEKMDELLDSMSNDSISTAFSGVEAAACATDSLRSAFSKKSGRELGHVSVRHQIEWNPQCVGELLPRSKRMNSCIFRNIKQFFRPDIQLRIEEMLQQPQMCVEILGPLLASGKAMMLEGDCLTHGKRCKLTCARRHVAGTSCRPFSKKGSGLLNADPEILFTLACIGLRLELQEPEILSENVRSIGASTLSSYADSNEDTWKPELAVVPDAGLGHLLVRFLGSKYFIERTVLDPCLLGYPVGREREFLKLIHRVKCQPSISPVSRFQRRFYRACAWSWKETFFMHKPDMSNKGVIANECLEELRWARARPTARCNAEEDMALTMQHTILERVVGAVCFLWRQ